MNNTIQCISGVCEHASHQMNVPVWVTISLVAAVTLILVLNDSRGTGCK